MLQKLRDRTSGWVATIIIALLMVPFLFVIDHSYLGGVGANNVAQVKAPPKWWEGAPGWWPVSMFWEHREVGVNEFRQRFEQERMRQRQEQGEAFDPRTFETVARVPGRTRETPIATAEPMGPSRSPAVLLRPRPACA